MTFDWTVSLGSILTVTCVILTSLLGISAFKTKLDILIELHATQLTLLREDLKDHRAEDDKRFGELSTRLFELVASVQRLIGQAEIDRVRDRRAH